MSLRLNLLVLCAAFAIALPVVAQTPPVRSVSDILVALDRVPADPVRLKKARETLDAPPPAGAGRTALADFHLNRARAANELGLVGPRIHELRRALDLGGGSKPHRVWASLAAAELRGGNFRSALEARKQAKEDAEPDMEGFLRGQHVQLGKLYLKLGDLASARQHMAEAEALLKALRARPGWRRLRFQWSCEVEDGLGQIESAVGRFPQAEARYRRALELAEKAIEIAAERSARKGLTETARTGLENQRDWMEAHLAGALRAQDRLREAEFHARNAAYRAIERSGQDSMHVAEMLGPLAQVLIAQRRGREALQLLDHAMRKLDALGIPPTAYGYVVFRRHKAGALTTLGRWNEALVEFEAMQAALAADPQLADTLGAPSTGWIRALISTGQAGKAVELATRLESRLRARMGPDVYQVAEVRGYLGAALAAMGRDAEALATLRDAIAVMIPASGEVERSGARFQRFSYIIQAYLAVLARVRGTALEKSSGIDAAAEAFVAADAVRGMSVQQAMLASSLRAAAATPQLAELVRQEQDSGQERDALYRIMADLMSRPADQVLPQVIADILAHAAELDDRHKNLQRDIRRRFPGFADLAAPRPATVSDIQAVLRPGEALIAIGFTELGSFVWAIPAQGRAEFATSSLARSEIKKLAARVRAAVDPKDFDILKLPPFDIEAARRLHDELLAPVRAGWESARHVFVTTGTNLSQLPFALLLTAPVPEATGEETPYARYASWPWLIRKAAISQLPAASSLVTLRRMQPGARDRGAFTGFGDPDFGARGTREEPRSTSVLRALALPEEYYRQLGESDESFTYDRIAPLPETRDEIVELARALRADPVRDVFLGPAASKVNVFAARLDKRRVVAFATHGLLRGEYPGVDQPALALANPGGGRHGLLTLDDILALKLDADWVVLSACNTAGGDGEGAEALSGLGRGFFYAGSRSILATHWRVESGSAKKIVVGVFEALAAEPKLTRAEALRRSMLAVMKAEAREGGLRYSYGHPFFWAPYALVGDGGG